MRIGLILGNRIRDLWAYTYLKCELEKLGNDVRIINPSDFLELNEFLPHAIVVPEMLTPIMKDMTNAARKKNMLIINMKAEGVVDKYLEECWVGGSSNPEITDLELVWGRNTQDLHVKHIPEYGTKYASKLHIVGSLRFDRYFGKLMSKFEFHEKHDIPIDKPIITYGGSLVWLKETDMIAKTPELEYLTYEEFTAHLRRLVRLRKKVNEGLFQVAKRFEDVTFVIKPHPYESNEAIQTYYKGIEEHGLKNVHVVKEIDIANLLNVTDIYLFWNSITSTEAWFLDKPTLSTHFDSELDYYLCDFISGSHRCTDVDKLIKWIEHYLNGGAIPDDILKNRKEFIEYNYHKVDGKRTTEVAKILHDFVNKNPREVKKELYYREFIYFFMYWIKKMLGLSINDRLQFWISPTRDLATDDDKAEMEKRIMDEVYEFGQE
jgi:surface carbohydrate biosynthesis protein